MTDDLHTLPEALVAAQRWDAALEALTGALASAPQDPLLVALLVRTLRALGRRREAVDAAQSLLSLTPHDPYALRLATLVLLDVGWVDEAIGLATRAVAMAPSTAANHLALSRAWAQSTRPGAVGRQLAAAREAVLLDPNSPDAQVQIGAALAADGDVAAAREAYREALRLDPNHSAALNNLAVLDLQSGHTGDAARHLAAALAADPQGPVARRNLDAMAIRMVRRAGWWLLLAPVPALVAAALQREALARALGVLALVGLPLVVLRWWRRALTPGQRRYLRGTAHRVRARTWIWSGLAGLLGGVAVVSACGWPQLIGWSQVGVYVTVVAGLALMRTLAMAARRTLRAEAAGRRARFDRLLGG